MICSIVGVAYAWILLTLLRHLHKVIPSGSSAIENMIFTGTCASLAIAMIFIGNKYLIKQNQKYIGITCAIAAYIYFYIIKLWPVPSKVFSVFTTSYSLFAFMAFTIAPLFVGLFLYTKNQKQSGSHHV